MNQVLLLALAAAAAALSINPVAHATGPEELGLSFLPALRCDGQQDVHQCLIAGPKDWAIGERDVMELRLRRLTANELVRGIIVGARENGFAGLRRYSTDTRHDPKKGQVPKFSPGFVLFRSKVIGITDAFFDTAAVIDSISGYEFADVVLLHELIHAYDDRLASIQPGFVAVTGWRFVEGRWEYTHPVRYGEYQGVVAETLTLYARGRYGEAWARDRSFATTMAFPMPTIQSLVAPSESFADILAHLILDSRASAYLMPAVVEWFERNVFPDLAQKARRF